MIEALALCIAHINDGDTFRLCDGTKVRLVAASGPIDTPEMPGSPRCRKGQQGWCDHALAKRARDRLSVLLQGRVTMQCDGRDRYDRALCRVRVNGRDVGDMIVAEGLGRIVEGWR